MTALAVTCVLHLGAGKPLAQIPDVHVTVPFLLLAIGAAAGAFVRREGAYLLPLAGVGLAAAAMVLGWALVVAAIIVLSTITIAVLSEIL